VLIVIAVPLAILLKDIPGGRVVIEVTIVVLAFTFTMCIIFFGTWYNIPFIYFILFPFIFDSFARILFPKQEALGKSMNTSMESSSTMSRVASNSKQSSKSSNSKSHDSANRESAHSVNATVSDKVNYFK
jgi:hypothetical protein